MEAGAMAAPQPRRTAFFDAPPDCVRAVLSYLAAKDLAAVACTCTAGRDAALEDELWAGLAARLARRVALERPPTAATASSPSSALAEARRVVGPLEAWAPAGLASYRGLVRGLLHPFEWMASMPLSVYPPLPLGGGGGLACPRLALPGSEAAAGPVGGLLLELRTPTLLGRGLVRRPILRVEPGRAPCPAHPAGTKPRVLCLRTGRPTPGVVPMPGPHPASLMCVRDSRSPHRFPGAVIACQGGCDTGMLLAYAAAEAAFRSAEAEPAADVTPGGRRAPPPRPGLPDYTGSSRRGGLPALFRAMGGLELGPGVGEAGSEGSCMQLTPLWGLSAEEVAAALRERGRPHKPPPPPRLPGHYPGSLCGLWKAGRGPAGPQLMKIYPCKAYARLPDAPDDMAVAVVGGGGGGSGGGGGARGVHDIPPPIRARLQASAMAGETAFVAAWTTADTPPTSLAAHAFALGGALPARRAERPPPPGAPPPAPGAPAGVPLLDFLGQLAPDGPTSFDPPRTSAAAATAWACLRVAAAHPAFCPKPGQVRVPISDAGQVADHSTGVVAQAFLLELAGWEGEAFALVKCPDDFRYDGRNALQVSLWVRVAENEVMG